MKSLSISIEEPKEVNKVNKVNEVNKVNKVNEVNKVNKVKEQPRLELDDIQPISLVEDSICEPFPDSTVREFLHSHQ